MRTKNVQYDLMKQLSLQGNYVQTAFNGLYCNTCAAQACVLSNIPIGLKPKVTGHTFECALKDLRNIFC